MTAYYSDKELKLLESKNTAATTVDIINPGAPVDVDAKEFVDGKGRRRIEITLDGAVAAALACPGSATRAAQRGAYGGSKAR
ncbi:MAG: hypothetical protein JWQ24_2711 [Tardiphaga sp.]|nr:hypothetical protein [Tardiphaga sp.]